MRIDLPLCNLRTCRLHCDGNCIDLDKYKRCPYKNPWIPYSEISKKYLVPGRYWVTTNNNQTVIGVFSGTEWTLPYEKVIAYCELPDCYISED